MVSLGTMGRSEEAIATELGLADEHCCDHVNAVQPKPLRQKQKQSSQ